MNEILRKLIKDKAFVICTVVLAVAALGIETAAQKMQLHFRKRPVPLRKELADFDTAKLAPYEVAGTTALPAEMEKELGTKHYFQCALVDTSIEDDRTPGKYISFFVTYYTGDPDQVPHVPDVCYVGGGNQLIRSRNVDIILPGLGLKNDTLPVRLLLFRDYRGFNPVDVPVAYFFAVNGAFEARRDRVRLRLADLRVKYAYFSKVEIAFVGPTRPNLDQAEELVRKFLAKALPILMQEHWPDWDEVCQR